MTIESCDGCAACCRNTGGIPGQVLNGPTAGVPCPLIDEQAMRCGDYANRPAICREFERGSASCLEVRRIYDVGAVAV